MSSAEERRAGEARGTRNGRKNPLAGRDTPVFTQTRRNNRGRQQFFTESTNTSYIPSPSPVRSAPFAKPRQAQNNGARALNGAYKAVSEDKENEPTQSTPALPEHRPQSQNSSAKRSPIHISAEGSPQPSARAPSRSVTRTPSPSRERDERPSLVSPASFVSESSEPPHGLPEIYRRIEDEEYIAGASDASESTKGSIGEPKNKRLSISPTGQRSSSVRRVPPQLLAQEVEVKRDDVVAPGQPHLSSGTSSPFEETVHTEPEMLARDERRVRDAIASDTVAFANARKGRPGLTLENLRRQEAGQDSKGESESQSSSNGKASSPGINIPSGWGAKARKDKRWLENITQGRQLANPEAATAQANGINSSRPFDKATSSVRNWLKEATASPVVEINEPTEDLQSQPLRERASFEKARLWESQRQKDSLAPPKPTSPLSALRERSIERLEKSAVATSRLGALGDRRSLQKLARKTSGQQISTLSNPVSESVSAGHIDQPTTSHPGQSAANSDSEGAASRSTDRASAGATSAAQITNPEGPVSPEVAKQLAFAAASQPRDSPDSRDLLRRFTRASSSSPAGAARNSQAGSLNSDTSARKQPSPLSLETGSVNRPTNSDSISAPAIKPLIPSVEQDSNHRTTAESIHNETATAQPASVTEIKSAQFGPGSHPVRTVADKTSASQIRTNNGESTEEESKPALVERIVQLASEEPRASDQGPYLQTPKVVGGWIDTPISKAKQLGMVPEDMSDPEADYDQDSLLEAAKIVLGTDRAAKVGPRLQKKSRRDLEMLAHTAPDLPHSALAAIIDHAKRKNRGEEGSEGEETLQLDEATIKSLEQLLVKDENEPTNDKLKHARQREDDTTDERHKSKPLTDQKPSISVKPEPTKEPKQQSKAPTNVRNGVLSRKSGVSDSRPRDGEASTGSKPALTLSIEDSPKSKNKKPKKSVAVVAPEETCDQAGEFHDFIWPCDACRRRAQAHVNGVSDEENIGVVQWQTLSIPRLWFWPPGHRLPWPTPLGWYLLFFVLCIGLESFVASLYTPPFYAWKMQGFGVDYNMVRPPFVIPKLIWRGPIGQAVRFVWWILSSVIVWVANVLDIDMGVFGAAPPKPSAVKYVFRQAYEPIPRHEPDIGVGRNHIIR